MNYTINELLRLAAVIETSAASDGDARMNYYLAARVKEMAGRLGDRKYYQGVGQRVSVSATVRTQEDLPDFAAFPPAVQEALAAALDAMLAQGIDPATLAGPIPMGEARRVDDDAAGES